MDLTATPRHAISLLALQNEPLLRAIAAAPGKSPIELATTTSRDKSNVGKSLVLLEKNGLITRDAGTVLTPAGSDIIAALDRAAGDAAAASAMPEGWVFTGVHADFTPNPHNPRRKFDPAKLEELADTIEAQGIIQPVVTLPLDADGKRPLYAGERRWRAAAIVNARHNDANRVRIPFVERPALSADEAQEARVVGLVENGQREGLTTYEEAIALRALIPNPYPSARQAAKALGYADPKTIQDRLRALEVLKGDALEAWKEDRIKWREVRDIFRPTPAPQAADPAQIDLEEAIDRPLSPHFDPVGARRDGIRRDLSKIAKPRTELLVALVELADACWQRPFPGHENTTATWLTPSGPASVVYRLLSAAGLIIRWVDGQQVTKIADEALVWLADNGMLTAPGTREQVLGIVRRGYSATKAAMLKPGEYITPGLNPPNTPDEVRSAAQSHMEQLVQGFSEKLELALLEVEDKAVKDPHAISHSRAGTGAWAALREQPAGGAIATLIERDLIQVEHVRDHWFARVTPDGEGRSWLTAQDLGGAESNLVRAGRLYQLRAKIMGDNVATQLGGQRLRYATSCLNTVRPEDIETAKELEEAKAGTAAKLAEIDRKKALEDFTALEVAWALWAAAPVPQDGLDGEHSVRVDSYWLDASASALVDRKLVRFSNAGGETGWVVRAGEALPAFVLAKGVDLASGQFDWGAVVDPAGQVLGLGLPKDRDTQWATTWLNVEPQVAATVEAPDFETDPEAEANAAVEEAQAAELLQSVVDQVESPEALPSLLEATGVQLPLKVGTGADLGVIFDATGRALVTVDQEGTRPNGWVAAFALLVAAALEDAGDGHEVTTNPIKWTVMPPEKFKPADMRRSITPWALVCLEDGRSFTSLKRHLLLVHGLTWAEYLTKWGLPNDYPSVAPATAQVRADRAWAVLQGLPK